MLSKLGGARNKAFSLIELSIVILIIGILIAGVTQSSRLIKAMKLASARAASQSSDVNSIKDVVLWLDATSDKAFTVDQPEENTAIAQWNDVNQQISGSYKTNAIQATGASQPLYISSGINGLPSLKFDGTDDFMAVATGFDGETENVTLFIVWQPLITNSLEMDLLEKWSDPPAYPYTLRSRTTGLTAFAAYDGTINPAAVSTTVRSINTTQLFSARRSKTNSLIQLWLNGTQEGGDVTDTTTTSTLNSISLFIGARGGASPAAFTNGYISEIIIFNRAIKTEERKAVEKYLGKKWGVKVA